jgi:hypothetical protein
VQYGALISRNALILGGNSSITPDMLRYNYPPRIIKQRIPSFDATIHIIAYASFAMVGSTSEGTEIL